MVSSCRDSEVYSPFPFYLEKDVFEKMVDSTLILNNIVKRLLKHVISNAIKDSNRDSNMGTIKDTIRVWLDEFENKGEIFNLPLEIPDFFWVRYDAFEREDGGIFFSEFNYDKPCAQREIAMADMMKPAGNPNEHFEEKFLLGFKSQCERFFGEQVADRQLCVAILVDPGHYEELHLAHLYLDFLEPLGYKVIIIGGKNLYIEDNILWAFGQKVDVLLRQFPTEFCGEIEAYKGILGLYSQKKVLLLNDPRAIVAQAKSLFATLWDMVLEENDFLTMEEKQVIRDTLPYTSLFSQDKVAELIKNKDKYVIKAAFGRFSEEVYIGVMHTDEEWLTTIEYILNCDKKHIIQQFCPIKKQSVHRFNGNCYEATDAHGNFGIYLVNEEFAGVSLRFSSDYLSCDDIVWINSVGISERRFDIKKFNMKDISKCRLDIWNKINNKAAFEYGYTGGYTSINESYSLDRLCLSRDLYCEIRKATEEVSQLFKKVQDYAISNIEVIGPALGLSNQLCKAVKHCEIDSFTFIGRYDWVVDSRGSLKLLEVNSETPAGLMESLVLSKLIKQNTDIKERDPNEALSDMIRNSFGDIASQLKKKQTVKKVGIVSCTSGEDWYNTTILHEQLKSLPYDFILGEVAGLYAGESGLELYGNKLDAVYRYYPLDWFDKDEFFDGVIEKMSTTPSINPTSTIITQSKAFFALLYELKGKGFFEQREKDLINKYIPKTYLAPKKSLNGLFCAKPWFDREGNSVRFSFKEPFFMQEEGQDYVFQEWIDIHGIELDVYSTVGKEKKRLFPVIGAYVAGQNFCGIYTRAGSSITDRWAVFLPTYYME